MPKMLIHSPAGTFDAADRQRVASALMTLGLDCERLPHSPLVRSTVWTYFSDYQADAVFMGDEPARLPVVTLQIYVLRAGGAYRASGPVANARRALGGADPCCRSRHGDDLACTSRGERYPQLSPATRDAALASIVTSLPKQDHADLASMAVGLRAHLDSLA